MTSPFADEVAVVGVGETEYGGLPGLVQPSVTGHALTPSERIGMAVRSSPTDVDAIDPVTGRAATEE